VKAKWNFSHGCCTVVLHFTINYLKTSHIFFDDVLPRIISDFCISSIAVAYISKVSTSTMLLLSIVIQKYEDILASSCIILIPNSSENKSFGSEVEKG
jgi:hypothetical protein